MDKIQKLTLKKDRAFLFYIMTQYPEESKNYESISSLIEEYNELLKEVDSNEPCCNMEEELTCEGCNKITKDLNPCEHCGFENLGFPISKNKKDAICEGKKRE